MKMVLFVLFITSSGATVSDQDVVETDVAKETADVSPSTAPMCTPRKVDGTLTSYSFEDFKKTPKYQQLEKKVNLAYLGSEDGNYEAFTAFDKARKWENVESQCLDLDGEFPPQCISRKEVLKKIEAGEGVWGDCRYNRGNLCSWKKWPQNEIDDWRKTHAKTFEERFMDDSKGNYAKNQAYARQEVERRHQDLLPKSDVAELVKCERAYVAEKCESVKASLTDKSKAMDCSRVMVCEEYSSTTEFLKACAANWGGAWKDAVVGLVEFVRDGLTVDEMLVRRQEYLDKCGNDLKSATNKACRQEIAAQFPGFLKPEEINGSKNCKGISREDPDAQTCYYGHSPAVLYRLGLTRLKQSLSKKDVRYIKTPWNDKEQAVMNNPKSWMQFLDGILQKMGVRKLACYDPIAVMEMRCYAFFSVIDPTVGYGAALKIAKIANLTKLEKILKLKNIGSASEVAPVFELNRSKGVTIQKAAPSSTYGSTSYEIKIGTSQTIPVKIETRGRGNPEQMMKDLVAALEEMPREMTKGLKAIEVNDIPAPNAAHADLGIKTIRINPTTFDYSKKHNRVNSSPDRYLVSSGRGFYDTVAHELGHITHGDFDALDGVWGKRWDAAMAKDARDISKYGATNKYEDIAETFTLYVASNGGIKHFASAQAYSNRFQILDEVLGVSTSGRTKDAMEQARSQAIARIKARLAEKKVTFTGGIIAIGGTYYYLDRIYSDEAYKDNQ